jgi:hypothetical protein
MNMKKKNRDITLNNVARFIQLLQNKDGLTTISDKDIEQYYGKNGKLELIDFLYIRNYIYWCTERAVEILLSQQDGRSFTEEVKRLRKQGQILLLRDKRHKCFVEPTGLEEILVRFNHNKDIEKTRLKHATYKVDKAVDINTGVIKNAAHTKKTR